MTMVYLAMVPSFEDNLGINFVTPYEHVAVDWPREDTPHYVVWSYMTKTDIAAFKSFAEAMDTAARWLKQSELSANNFYI